MRDLGRPGRGPGQPIRSKHGEAARLDAVNHARYVPEARGVHAVPQPAMDQENVHTMYWSCRRYISTRSSALSCRPEVSRAASSSK